MDEISIVLPDGSMMKKMMDLFLRAGLPITIKRRRTKEATVDSNFIGKIVFQRPQEIPQLIEEGLFDIGLVGQDWLANAGVKLPILLQLPIGRKGNEAVKIVLAVSEDSGLKSLYDLPPNCRLATEYAKLAKIFLYEKGRPDIKIVASYGNTEHKIGLGLADAIIDVTETGESMKENGLRIIGEIMPSSIVLAANLNSYADTNKRPWLEYFADLIYGAFQGPRYVSLAANMPGNLLEKASEIMKGLKGPTCSPLFGIEGWFALQSVIPRTNECDVKHRLKEIGVVDIYTLRDIPMLMMKRPPIL